VVTAVIWDNTFWTKIAPGIGSSSQDVILVKSACLAVKITWDDNS